MDLKKVELAGWLVTIFVLFGMIVCLVLARFEVFPCKYTLADVPPGFEIVHDNGVYRARVEGATVLLTAYSGNDTSLCRAIERARGQHEFRQKDRQEQDRKWEVVR